MSFSKKETTHKLSGMNKYYYADSDVEVKVGGPIDLHIKSSAGNITIQINKVDEKTLENLVKIGAIRKVSRMSGRKLLAKEDIPMNLEFYVSKLEKQLGQESGFLTMLQKATWRIAPASVSDLLLMFIAKYLDEQYPDHIRESKELFGIDVEGRIVRLDPKRIKTFRTFAAFRSLDDARIACRILKPLSKKIFKGGK
nr:MAG TPA: hypothetical protein [Crassvirales sp.]